MRRRIESITDTDVIPSNNLTLYRYKRSNKCLHEQLGDGIKLTLMLIPAGEFSIGASESAPKSDPSERPQHSVKLESFLMGRYPVTQAQWRVVADYPLIERELNSEPSKSKGNNLPVERVSWEEAKEFCQRLSVKTGRIYRLPSEAEWEYGCRAETKTPFHYGETITTDLANYNSNNSPKGKYRGETTDVGSFLANRWGLCDLHGNVWEWCEDDWHSNYEGAPTDGRAWLEENTKETTRKLLRGGSWHASRTACRSAFRNSDSRVKRSSAIGFRVCCEPPRTLSPWLSGT